MDFNIVPTMPHEIEFIDGPRGEFEVHFTYFYVSFEDALYMSSDVVIAQFVEKRPFGRSYDKNA